MKQYLDIDAWSIVESQFNPQYNKISESIFSLGNGKFGQRGCFEEDYSGQTMQGSYVAGVYYPDKTRVGWWKNGYPEYFAKVLNAADWKSISIEIDGQILDLNKCEIKHFRRELNMREGFLSREFSAINKNGKEIKVYSKRFCSIACDNTAAVYYSLTPVNFSGNIKINSYINGNIKNSDANYDEFFWNEVESNAAEFAFVTMRTKKTEFEVCTGLKTTVTVNGQNEPISANAKEKYVSHLCDINAEKGVEISVCKFVAIVSSMNVEPNLLATECEHEVSAACNKGFSKMADEQKEAWAAKWQMSDIIIEGDVSAQQAIRFNIFQLNQTYTGNDERLNIGPKGFTGEKYGGSSYWDTEAYCVPFYLSTSESNVARNLLLYRYKHLPKAIENACKLGFSGGAALYPMVTMNGEECHNEWEITFEEIHRNGAIAYAIYDYINYTGDEGYIAEYGLEVLIAISRFWAQRVNWSNERKQYVMLGVTGPNEYENNVNNNWYTSYIARWCMQYTMASINKVKSQNDNVFKILASRIKFDETSELSKWKDICNNIYLGEDKDSGIFLQQDGYLDKEQILVKDLPKENLPLNQNWSWDRILRSCFIKQADVLQGMYFFENDFDIDTIRRNFDFYEPRTVHESSLSPCIHSILASKLGDTKRAYDFYLRTARLDLDDYNNDTEDGCHITSMAGTWMSVIKGFAGMRVNNGKLTFNPCLPENWESFSFNIIFREVLLNILISKEKVVIESINGISCTISVYGKDFNVTNGTKTTVQTVD